MPGMAIQMAPSANTQVNLPAGPAKGATGVAPAMISTTPPAKPNPLGGTMIAMPCAMQKTTVGTVNGQTKGTVFTPDPTYNTYTIKGCNFGDTQGEAHLNGPFAAGQVKMQIEFWSDTQIVAKVDTTVSGEMDQDNVSLLVAPVSGPQVQAPGFKFYAARATVQLKGISQGDVLLASVNDNASHPVQPEFESPAAEYYGATAQVHRVSGSSAFGGNSDLYDFRNLTPGFTTDSFQVWSTDLKPEVCGGVKYATASTLYFDAHLSANWVGDNVQVNFGEQHCHDSLAFGLADVDFGQSRYGLIVYVSGPRGIEPSCGGSVPFSSGSSGGGSGGGGQTPQSKP
jgi:hypothetical protein